MYYDHEIRGYIYGYLVILLLSSKKERRLSSQEIQAIMFHVEAVTFNFMEEQSYYYDYVDTEIAIHWKDGPTEIFTIGDNRIYPVNKSKPYNPILYDRHHK